MSDQGRRVYRFAYKDPVTGQWVEGTAAPAGASIGYWDDIRKAWVEGVPAGFRDGTYVYRLGYRDASGTWIEGASAPAGAVVGWWDETRNVWVEGLPQGYGVRTEQKVVETRDTYVAPDVAARKGFNIWPWLLGALALAGLLFFLTRPRGGTPDAQQVVAPAASPAATVAATVEAPAVDVTVEATVEAPAVEVTVEATVEAPAVDVTVEAVATEATGAVDAAATEATGAVEGAATEASGAVATVAEGAGAVATEAGAAAGAVADAAQDAAAVVPCVPKVDMPDGMISAMQEAGLPVGDTVVYTADTDPDKMLGTDGGPLAKFGFADSRLPKADGVAGGGVVEFFTSPDDATARAKAAAAKAGEEIRSFFGPIMVRLSGKMSADQAKEYTTAFATISGCEMSE